MPLPATCPVRQTSHRSVPPSIVGPRLASTSVLPDALLVAPRVALLVALRVAPRVVQADAALTRIQVISSKNPATAGFFFTTINRAYFGL